MKRKCPVCPKMIVYKSIQSFVRAKLRKTWCKSCCAKTKDIFETIQEQTKNNIWK